MNKKIIYLVIFLAIVFLLAPAALWLLKNKDNLEPFRVEIAEEEPVFSDCEHNEKPVFTHDITEVGKIGYIVPPGHVEEYSEGNVFKSHSYIKGPNVVPIYAPVDATLFQGVYVLENNIGQYALFFEVSCEIYYLFDHVVDPSEKIKNVFPAEPVLTTENLGEVEKVQIKAGELIGYSLGPKFEQWDFGVYNRKVDNDFSEINAPIMERDINAVCPYDFFPEEKKQKYYSLFGYHLNGDIPSLICQK